MRQGEGKRNLDGVIVDVVDNRHREDRGRPTEEAIEEGLASRQSGSQQSWDTQTFQAPDLPNRRSSYQNRAPESVSASSRSDQSPFTPASFVTNYQDTRGLSLDVALNPDRSVEGETRGPPDTLQQSLPEAVNTPRKHDPVDMGLISRPSAQNLYEGCVYHDLQGVRSLIRAGSSSTSTASLDCSIRISTRSHTQDPDQISCSP
jgi:hypothetical protein